MLAMLEREQAAFFDNLLLVVERAMKRRAMCLPRPREKSMDELEKLIAAGPDPRHAIRAKVLSRYRDIKAARDLGRTWASITNALRLDAQRAGDVARAFRKIRAAIDAGKLTLPDTDKKAVQQQQAPGKRNSGNFIDLDKV